MTRTLPDIMIVPALEATRWPSQRADGRNRGNTNTNPLISKQGGKNNTRTSVELFETPMIAQQNNLIRSCERAQFFCKFNSCMWNT